jgi:hypothetical protein
MVAHMLEHGLGASNMTDKQISEAFIALYKLLLEGNTVEHEECLGLVAEAQAIWLNEN